MIGLPDLSTGPDLYLKTKEKDSISYLAPDPTSLYYTYLSS